MRRGYDVSGAGPSSLHPHARLCSGLRFHGRNRSTSSSRGLRPGHTLPGTPSTTHADSTPTNTTSATTRTSSPPDGRPYRPATVVVLPTHHRPTFRPFRRVVVHRHLGVLDKHRQARPVVPQALQDPPPGRVQVRGCQLRLPLCSERRYGHTQLLVRQRNSPAPPESPVARRCVGTTGRSARPNPAPRFPGRAKSAPPSRSPGGHAPSRMPGQSGRS